jgi:uncharacterized membrane protein YphA (DoxX/SURF4 family)
LTASAVLAAVVGAVLLYAGVRKLGDRSSFDAGASSLGVPSSVAVFVPWVEVVLGAALILDVIDVVARFGALALLLSFTVVIVSNLLRGNRPACACFGARATSPISWWTVARNGVLIALIVAALLAV